jgi:hypothetical protein
MFQHWPLTWERITAFLSHGSQVYHVLWIWNLQFSHYPAFIVFLVNDSTTLPFDLENNTILPLIIVIKYTKLYDPEAYSLVSSLSRKFFSYVTLRHWLLTLKNYRVLLIIMIIKSTKFHGPEATFRLLSWQQRFSTKCCYDIYLWSLTFKTIGIFLSSGWIIVPNCMILKLTVQSLSCLQGFSTKWCYDLDL